MQQSLPSRSTFEVAAYLASAYAALRSFSRFRGGLGARDGFRRPQITGFYAASIYHQFFQYHARVDAPEFQYVLTGLCQRVLRGLDDDILSHSLLPRTVTVVGCHTSM